ncbi:hypothetical protein [Kordiimonas sp.]|uniref:hypothetical protein n=1 Tax=Kordiimonas sp. TaxID=1970157 RepID=UPI003A8CB278
MTNTAAATGEPSQLEHTYYFMQDLSFKTVVTGPDRSTATITMQTGRYGQPKTPVWSTTLDADNPVFKTETPISVLIPFFDRIVFGAGTVFMLRAPTATRNGEVIFDGIVTSKPSSAKLRQTMFSWPRETRH